MTLAQAAIATLLGSTLPGTALLAMRSRGILASPRGRDARYRRRLSRLSASCAATACACAAAWPLQQLGGEWTAAAAGLSAGAAAIALACHHDSIAAYRDHAPTAADAGDPR